jgi:hypothetical protein
MIWLIKFLDGSYANINAWELTEYVDKVGIQNIAHMHALEVLK